MKRVLIASAVFAITVYASAPLGAQSMVPVAPKDMVAATVNGQPIMESDIQSFIGEERARRTGRTS